MRVQHGRSAGAESVVVLGSLLIQLERNFRIDDIFCFA